MADRYRLRPASLADTGALAALEAASFPDPWTPDQLAIALDDECVVATVAESAQGDVVGYVMSRTVSDEGEILSVTAAPDLRRRGIGRLLLDSAIGDMLRLGARTAWLEVRRSNVAALAMYAGAGFVPTGVRRRYYEHPVEDALLLRRDLTLDASRGAAEH